MLKAGPNAPDGDRLTRVLMAQYKKFLEDPPPNLLAWIDPADVRTWYFLVVGLDRPYLGGEYLFKLTACEATKDRPAFPQSPPSFAFLTHNGLFQLNVAHICISVGEFHANDAPGAEGSYGWRPSLGMKGFAVQVVNGMICHDLLAGIGILNLGDPVKVLYAQMSRAQNAKQYPLLAAAFESLLDGDSEPAWNAQNGRLRLAGKPPLPRARAPRPDPAPVLAPAPTGPTVPQSATVRPASGTNAPKGPAPRPAGYAAPQPATPASRQKSPAPQAAARPGSAPSAPVAPPAPDAVDLLGSCFALPEGLAGLEGTQQALPAVLHRRMDNLALDASLLDELLAGGPASPTDPHRRDGAAATGQNGEAEHRPAGGDAGLAAPGAFGYPAPDAAPSQPPPADADMDDFLSSLLEN
jgi:ubiquitin-protein ligase